MPSAPGLCGLLVALALAAPGCCEGSSIKDDFPQNFSIPTPAGWVDATAGSGLTVRLDQEAPAAPGQARGQISVGPWVADLVADPSDPDLCARLGKMQSSALACALDRVEVVSGPAGPACQVSMTSEDGKRKISSTIVKGARSAWVISCSLDPRDGGASTACRSVVAGFKFIDPR